MTLAVGAVAILNPDVLNSTVVPNMLLASEDIKQKERTNSTGSFLG